MVDTDGLPLRVFVSAVEEHQTHVLFAEYEVENIDTRKVRATCTL